MKTKALSKYRIVDFTAAKAGPLCTALLADFGAEVIHIEQPKGDPNRKLAPGWDGISSQFLSLHRGKKCIQVNAKTEAGKKIIEDLVAKSDVFIENSKPGAMARMGLDYESLKKINPNIIYASISGFGQEGPYQNRAAYDTVVQAMSGFMSVTGPEGGPYCKAGPSIADGMGAIGAALGIAVALVNRENTGHGTYIDVSMLDMMTYLLEEPIGAYLNFNEIRRPIGNKHPINCIAEDVQVKDGSFILQMASNEMHQKFFSLIGLPDLTEDPRFATGSLRRKNDQEFMAIVKPVLMQYTVEEMKALLNQAKIPYGEINTIEQITEDPQFKFRKRVIPVSNDKIGTHQIVGNPLIFSDIDVAENAYCDQLGEHNVEVLRNILEMKDEDIVKAFAEMDVEVNL